MSDPEDRYKDEPLCKREEKRKRKESKRTRHRRLSNSNLLIPTTDEEASGYESDSSQSIERAEMQCPRCAGKHDHEECRNRSGNAKYNHYESVRNRFAKDVGFNYRRDQQQPKR